MFDWRSASNWGKRIRGLIWPKKGLIRAWKYLALRLSRMNRSPHAIAAGIASGAAASFTPLLGLHIILACALAFVTRGSMIAAVLGTAVGNPVTFPFFFSATYWVGGRLQDLAATEASEALERIAAGLDEDADAEADAAAEVLLNAAEDMIEGVSTFAALDLLWPVVSTMLIGAILLVPVAYVLIYFAARMILHSLARRRYR